MKPADRPETRAIREEHGMRGTRTYRAWSRMKNRCNNPKATQYPWYGARGIKVCEQWNRSFLAFLADMGEAPTEKHTIERIENDGNYEPNNCEWVTQMEQSKNKRPRRDTVYLTYNGKTLSVTDWAKQLGICRHVIYERIKKNWPLEQMLSAEKHVNGWSTGRRA
jgi:hypothetical protein